MSSTSSASAALAGPTLRVRRDPMVLGWLVGVAVSSFGDAVWTVALAWTAAHTLAPALAGAVIGAELLPQAALVLLGGVIADRAHPRRVLVAGQVARALVLVTGAVVWRAGFTGAATLFGIALCFGVASGLTIPAGTALVRQLVAVDDLRTVMGWNQISGRVTRLLGAPTGGIVVAWGGPVAAMLVDAVTFAVIAAVLAVVVRPRFAVPRAEHRRWRDSFTDGVGYLRRTPTARLFVVGLTALNVFVTPVTALGLALRVQDSGWGPHWLGIADGALAGGAIIGSVVGIRWRPSHPARTAFRTLIVQGAGLAAAGLPSRPGVLLGMTMVGLTAGMASVWLSASFLTVIDPAYTGRVSSVTSLGDMALMPLTIPLLGVAVASVGVLPATAGCGLAMSVLCLWFATWTQIAELG